MDAASLFAARGETKQALNAQSITRSGNIREAKSLLNENQSHPVAFRIKNAIRALEI